MVEPYLIACGVLLLGSVLARVLPVSRRSFDDDHEDGWDLTPRELAYLRRGPYGVVLTVLAELHGDGSVDLRRGRVERTHRPRPAHAPPADNAHPAHASPTHNTHPAHASPAHDDRLTEAVYAVLSRVRHPRLVALAPGVRRACAPLRWELRERGLLPPLRRRLFAVALLVYAGGLATATALETGLPGSTVASAVGVCSAAGLLALGPRRTLAGARELAWHRRALARVAATGQAETDYLLDLVAAYGLAAVRLLDGQVPSGALAQPASAPEPSPEPAAQPSPVPAPEPWLVDVSEPWPMPAPEPPPVPAVGSPRYLRPVLVPVPPPPVPEFPVIELPVRHLDRLPVAA